MITETIQRLEAKFRVSFPEGFFLNKENLSETEEYFKEQGWISKEDRLLSLEKPGEGNMNYVLRARFRNSKPFIIKQSRPWVEKYPQFKAPIIRNEVERQFLELVHSNEELSQSTPKIIGHDSTSNILVTEDIQKSNDLTYVYKREKGFTKQEIVQVIKYANQIAKVKAFESFPENIEMRRLNHQHIFNLPFEYNNGFNLDAVHSGLQELSNICKADHVLKQKIYELGEIYLSKGNTLLHGDLYPGSILKSPKGLYIIDPEFSFIGPPEWDIAVFIAHLILAQTETELVNLAIDSFQKSNGFDQLQFCGFIGVEIIRRIIGLAQLPIELTLEEKEHLLRDASGLIRRGLK